MKELAALKNLTTLVKRGAFVGDEEATELAELKSLVVLDLRFSNVTDAGVKKLAALKNLTELNLEYNGTIDAFRRYQSPRIFTYFDGATYAGSRTTSWPSTI